MGEDDKGYEKSQGIKGVTTADKLPPTQLELINKQINRELANQEVHRALLATTFKGLEPMKMKQALMEGMIRGWKFEDFLKKNVYAIPFGTGYSLVGSIDHARKIGAKNGIVGKLAPTYEMDGVKIISCTVTVKKRFADGYIGDFTATVFFSEFDKKKQQWVSQPRNMIAKVAEMHSLRMACPEDLSQFYSEDEIDETKPNSVREIKNEVDGASLKMGNFKKDDKNKNQENIASEDNEIVYDSEDTEGK